MNREYYVKARGEELKFQKYQVYVESSWLYCHGSYYSRVGLFAQKINNGEKKIKGIVRTFSQKNMNNTKPGRCN